MGVTTSGLIVRSHPVRKSSGQGWATRHIATLSRTPLTFAPSCVIFGLQVRCDNVNCPKFIDLFCGIGGMRLAFESAGAQCVFSSDWDKYAQITYEANFGEKPHGDLRAIASEDLPPHDILVAGFPCQPFSISGVSKKDRLLLESEQ